MAKKIRFPLKMNDADVRSIEELRDNYDMEAVIGYYTDGKLSVWLRDRYYTDEADAIDALDESDENLGSKIASVLGVEISDDGVDVDEIRQRLEKYEFLSRYISDKEILDNVDIVAVDQDDLYDILDSGSDKIYLFKETFTVPANKGDVTYIGLNGAKVKIQGKTDYDFKKINMFFSDIEFVISDSKEMYGLSECYYNGNGVAKNIEKGVELKKKAAEAGNAEAQFDMGLYYIKDDKYTEALNLWTKAAKQGYDKAQTALGTAYYMGLPGLHQNFSEAIKWLTKAAEQGFSEAQNMLGNVYFEKTKDLDPHYVESLKWYTKAAYQGNREAMYHLGYMYIDEKVGINNRDKGFVLISKAANKGLADAWIGLGDLYCMGLGVKINLIEAEKCYKKAMDFYSKEDDVDYILLNIYEKLSFIYGTIFSPLKNKDKAKYWKTKAKETRISSNHSSIVKKMIGKLKG